MRMPLLVWMAYADRAPWALNESVVRMGVAAMMPHMTSAERLSLMHSLQRRKQRVIAPSSTQEMAADAALYGITFEDARVK